MGFGEVGKTKDLVKVDGGAELGDLVETSRLLEVAR